MFNRVDFATLTSYASYNVTWCKQSVKFTNEAANVVVYIVKLCIEARVEYVFDLLIDGVVQRVLARGSAETTAARTHKMLSSGI